MKEYIFEKIKLIYKSPKFYIFILSLLPIFWFQGGKLINGSDLTYYLFDFHHVAQSFYLWNDLRDLGKSSIDILNIFPYFTLSLFLSKLNFSLGFIEKFFFIFWIYFSGLSMYYLATKAFNANKIWAFFSAIFYMFNPYLLQYQWIAFNKFFFFYTFIPFILMLYINGINKKYSFKNSIIFIISLGLIFSVVNITYFVVLGFVLFLIGIFYFIFNKNSLRWDIIKFNFVSILLILSIYLWMIIPVFSNYYNQGTFNYYNSSISQSRTDLASQETGFMNNFRLMGNWGFFLGSHGGDLYIPYSTYYKTPLFMGLSFVFPILFIFGIYKIFKYEKNKEKHLLAVCLSFIVLIGLFLVKGFHSPFSSVNYYLYNNIPGFGMFRNQFVKLGILIVLPYSVFIGYIVFRLYNKLRSVNKFLGFAVIFIIFVLMFPVYQFPYFTGEIYPKNYTALKSSIVMIPDYLFDTLKWISLGKKDTRFAILPFKFGEKADMRSYDWGFGGTSLLFSNSERPIFIGSFIGSEKEKYFNKLIQKDYAIVKYLTNFNIGYLILENDRDDYKLYPNNASPEEIKSELEKLTSVDKITTFGKTDIYKIDENFFSPHFYTPQTLITTSQNLETLPKIISQSDYQIRSATYFSEQNKNLTKVVLDSFEQNNLKRIIVAEAKTDKIDKLDENIKTTKNAITNLAAEDFNKLSQKDKGQLESLEEENKILEQKKVALQIDPAQFFATVENSDNYNLSFQLSSCQEEKQPLLDNIPLITINDKSYDIPYEIINGTRKYKIKTDNNCFANIEDIELNQGELKIATNYIIGLENLVFTKDYPKEVKTPVLEFKKVNPTKYIVRVHQAEGSFPLVFSESFHEGWKAYLAEPQVESEKLKVESGDLEKYKILDGNEEDPGHKSGISDGASQASNDILKDYKILDGNSEDQATRDELADYINKGWVTDLGNGNEKEIKHNKWEDNKEKLDYIEKYKIDFISKNFQDTIQNDNLPSGHFYDTWLSAKMEGSDKGGIAALLSVARNDSVVELPEESHLTANGYANSWMIDVNKVCGLDSRRSLSAEVAGGNDKGEGGNDNAVCVKNVDGSYDFTMVVEFWPQRLFYIGLGISGITLLGCLGYLGWDFARRRKRKVI